MKQIYKKSKLNINKNYTNEFYQNKIEKKVFDLKFVMFYARLTIALKRNTNVAFFILFVFVK